MQSSRVCYTTRSGVHSNITVFIGLSLIYAWIYDICILVVARNERSSYRPTCDQWHLMDEERPKYISGDLGHLVASRSRLHQITRLVQRSRTYRDSSRRVHHEALRHLGRIARLVFGPYHRTARSVCFQSVSHSSSKRLIITGLTVKTTVCRTVSG